MRNSFKTIAWTVWVFGLLYASPLQSQPAVSWLRHFDANGEDQLRDVFCTANGDFVACGVSRWGDGLANSGYWVIRVDPDGDLIWSSIIRMGSAYSIVETDSGDFVIAGGGDGGIGAAMLNRDGELIWQNVYAGSNAWAVIELKSGVFIICGRSEASGILLCVDYQGNEVWHEIYNAGGEGSGYFTSLLETDGGVVAAGGAIMTLRPRLDACWLVKVQDQGRVIWMSTLSPTQNLNWIWGMCSRPGGMVCGGDLRDRGQRDPDTGILLVDENGDLESHQKLDMGEVNLDDQANAVIRLPRGHYGVIGNAANPGHTILPYVMVTRSDGSPEWRRIFDDFEGDGLVQNTTAFSALTTTRRNELVASGRTVVANHEDTDGLLIKLEPLLLEPTLLHWTPRDSMLTVLRGDSVYFAVRARFYHQDSLNYTWWMNGDSLDCDTSISIRFEQLGNQDVTCRIGALDNTISIRWHVTVTDLYVHSFTPDSLNLALRRGASVDFAIDSVAAVGGNDNLQFLWTKSNLDNQGEPERSGEDAQATIPFLQSGNYAVEGFAYRGESHDAVVWNVAVRGAIWSFAPEDITLEVLPDSLVRFEVVPSEPDSVGWSITWLIDGEVARFEETMLDWRFFGEADSCPPHLVQVVVADSVEADTVTWEVTVRELGIISDEEAGQAGTPVLLNVSPNPFNLSTRLSFSLAQTTEVRLEVFNLRGQQVATIEEGKFSTGYHSVVWDAVDCAGGIYLVRLSAGEESTFQKIVLLK